MLPGSTLRTLVLTDAEIDELLHAISRALLAYPAYDSAELYGARKALRLARTSARKSDGKGGVLVAKSTQREPVQKSHPLGVSVKVIESDAPEHVGVFGSVIGYAGYKRARIVVNLDGFENVSEFSVQQLEIVPINETSLEELFASARQHGEESDPEHEVGDLQQLVGLCWERLSPAQREEAAREFEALREGS